MDATTIARSSHLPIFIINAESFRPTISTALYTSISSTRLEVQSIITMTQ